MKEHIIAIIRGEREGKSKGGGQDEGREDRYESRKRREERRLSQVERGETGEERMGRKQGRRESESRPALTTT